MIKKLAILLGVAGLGALCAGLAACKKQQSELDKYDVLVYYDANGGSYTDGENVSMADGFKFSDYEADEDGNYHLKLTEPTSSDRSEQKFITKSQNFFAGWYKTRTLVTESDGSIKDSSGRLIKEEDGKYYVVNEDGNFLDEDGNVLIERDGKYYVVNTNDEKKREVSYPVYEYDGYWDFENDTLECSKSSERKLTLYAGWVPYYTFEYYYKENDEWTKYGETYFDYKTTHAPDSRTFDHDTIWVPQWGDVVMNHNHKFEITDTYIFPKLEGRTFVAAYTDEACTQKIESSFTHQGTLDVLHAVAVNRVQKIYVEFENVVRYRIKTAKQLADNPNLNGYYTILNDLDFSGTNWPALFATGNFNGEFLAEDGKTVTISNAKATLSSETATYFGLFGKISKDAKVSGITFNDAVVTIKSTGRFQRCFVGTFAGEIEDGATVSSVTVGGNLILEKVNSLSKDTVNINMVVGSGSKEGVTVAGGGIKLQAAGEQQLGETLGSYVYLFLVDVAETTVSADGTVNIVFTSIKKDNQIEDIITFGGN